MKTCIGVVAIMLSLPAFAQKPRRDYIQEMKALAHQHHMYYVIFCLPEQADKNYQFQAELCEADCRLQFAEDGGKDWWSGAGASQELAARDLVESFTDGRDRYVHYALHRKPVGKIHQCPSEIRGGPQ
jgi:hypothetical protein